MIKVLIDTSPLANANSIRGVGNYTRFITQYLEKIEDLEVKRAQRKSFKHFKPDIVHYPFFDLFFNTLPLSLNKKKKVIVTVHDVIPLKFPKYYPAGVKGKLKFLKQKEALKLCDAVITDSFASKKDIQEYLGISEDKIHVVYLAANPELTKPDDKIIGKVSRKYKLPKNYLLYVGDINYNKNIPQLIKTLKYLPPQVKLVCVGRNFVPANIPEWQWIETQIAMSDVSQKIKFIPDLTSDATEELAAIYSGAIAYIQPSLAEGFGLPILEAMQCQTPVIASENSSLKEVGDKYVLFSEATAEAFAEKVEQILAWTIKERKEHLKEALLWTKSFSWEKAAHETFLVYQKVMDKK